MIDDVRRDARALLAPDAQAGHPHVPPLSSAQGHVNGVDRVEVARAALVGLAAAAVWFHLWGPAGRIDLIGIVATLLGAYPIFREALENVVERRMTMELSMTIALVAALSIGQTFTALVITAFVLAAEILEHATVSRGRVAVADLLACLPQTARVRRADGPREVHASELVVGDSVLVDPGALVPVDGTVVAGHAFVDEARITGEAMPAEKSAGAVVYAGTVSRSGALEVRAERLGRDTSFGRIIEAIESAERSRAPVERLADRLSGYLVYFALASAALTLLVTHDIVSTISVIIVAGACGIAAGTPLAVLGAIGRAARAGAIVKGGRYLEALASTTVVAFDKTGTMTFGAPIVRDVRPATGVTAVELLAAAGSAELRSEHPLARAIVAHARDAGAALHEPRELAFAPGFGLRARVHGDAVIIGSARLLAQDGVLVPAARDGSTRTASAGEGAAEAGSLTPLETTTDVHVARNGAYLGTLAFADSLRAEAHGAVARLRALGIRTVMLTGDRRGPADAIGREAGVDAIVAELLPDEKAAYVAELVAAGQVVVMLGDGINDAPALMRASVGVAMGSGTDVTRESADIVLIGNDLSRLVATVEIARRTKAIVMQNFIGTLVVDAAGIALAAAGALGPLAAAFVHVASELAFILNATRMLAPRGPHAPGD